MKVKKGNGGKQLGRGASQKRKKKKRVVPYRLRLLVKVEELEML